MSILAAGSGVDSVWGYGTDWLYFLGALVPFLALSTIGWRLGRGRRGLMRWAGGLERLTGLPAWAAAAYVTGFGGLSVALLGFLWDVSWHIDYGRDDLIWTPGHTAILVGLAFIPAAGAASIAVATRTKADVGLRWREWRAPYSALTFLVLGLGAMAGFPLDEFWHRAYGVDVSMWGPTHLTMIGGASFAPLTMLLLLRESGPGAKPRVHRRLMAGMCGATLFGLSTFQLEFDLGVSQWQQLYHPILVAIAGGFALVVARRVIGRGGALLAALDYTVLRLLLAGLIGGPLHHRMPYWSLYLGGAIAVEIAAALTRNRGVLAQGLAAGVGVGTIGLGGEWLWTHLVGYQGWQGTLAGPRILVAVAAAIAAALLGTAAGRVLTHRAAGLRTGLLAVAGLVVIGTVVFANPRHAADAQVTLRTTPAGPGRVNVSVTVDPPGAVEDADRFDMFSWQGGHAELQHLRRVSDDTWVADDPAPVGGSWKTLVRLAKADVLAGAVVYMPHDEEIGAAEIPVVAEKTVPFERDTRLLMREAKDGPAWPAVVAYSLIAGIAAVWVGSLVLTFRALSRRRAPAPLEGKRVVVTGALGGIGDAVIDAYRSAGAQVVGIDLVDGEDVLAANVVDAAETERAVRAAAERLGGIDVLVNLAGIGRAQDSGDLPTDEARRVLDVNFWGTWNATAAAVPWLVESHGHVVVTASGLAIANVPWAAAYAASKRAVTAYADTLRLEYRGRLTVTTVNPGYIRTPIHDVVAASGASLEGVVPPDELDEAARAYLRAATDRPRDLATSRRTTRALRAARRNPALTDLFVSWRITRLNRPDPTFVRSGAEHAERRQATRRPREKARR